MTTGQTFLEALLGSQRGAESSLASGCRSELLTREEARLEENVGGRETHDEMERVGFEKRLHRET